MSPNLYIKGAFIVCIIIVLCPQKTNLTFPLSSNIQRTYYKSTVDPNVKLSKLTPHLDGYNLLRDQKLDSFNNYEPGFDFTEMEMKKFKIWPRGVVPYYIDVLSFGDKVLRDAIRSFLNTLNAATSLNFVELPSPPKDDKSRWVFFVNRRRQLKCSDPHIRDFTNEGVQQIVLGYECLSNGGGLAESVLALVGVPAQHNAPDRDNYIKVNWENVSPDKKYLFAKLKNNEWLFHDINYDFLSAGHYDLYRNSENGRATIETWNKFPNVLVGESSTLSAKDIQKIRMLYNYISKKKTDFPDCHKLFEPGVNFKNIKPKKHIVAPRKKPRKYLGIAVDKNQNMKDDADGNFNERNNQTFKELSIREENDSASDSNQEENNFSSLKGKLYLPNKNGPLEELSDFNTDEEYDKLKQGKVQKLNSNP